MAQMQKPNPKNFATIGKLKEIIAKNNADKKYIEDKRKAYGTDMSNADEGDLKDQVRLAQIEDQNKRYGALIAKANKDAAIKAKNMVPISRLIQVRDSLVNQAGIQNGAGDSAMKDAKKVSGGGKDWLGRNDKQAKAAAQQHYDNANSNYERADRYTGIINKARSGR